MPVDDHAMALVVAGGSPRVVGGGWVIEAELVVAGLLGLAQCVGEGEPPFRSADAVRALGLHVQRVEPGVSPFGIRNDYSRVTRHHQTAGAVGTTIATDEGEDVPGADAAVGGGGDDVPEAVPEPEGPLVRDRWFDFVVVQVDFGVRRDAACDERVQSLAAEIRRIPGNRHVSITNAAALGEVERARGILQPRPLRQRPVVENAIEIPAKSSEDNRATAAGHVVGESHSRLPGAIEGGSISCHR